VQVMLYEFGSCHPNSWAWELSEVYAGSSSPF
jgi:hypothetical protein